MSNDMSREEWVQAVGRQLARSMPDMFPEGFAYHTAEKYAEEGGYERYINGDFAPNLLWEPAR